MNIPRIADDNDFESMKRLIDNNDGWTMEISKSKTEVWTRTVSGCNFNMVKMNSCFDDIEPDIVYDVLLDPDYRKDWDSHMLASEDIGCINVNNDIGYYAMSCPPPLKPRDFVLMRSWLDTGPNGEQMLLSRSVPHKDFPPKKGYVRAVSYITGFVLRPAPNGGCLVGYVAHCDPQGQLPPWLVNKVTHSLGPRMVKDLRKASQGYLVWKKNQLHNRKPWRNPEEIICPRISIDDCLLPEQLLELANTSMSSSSTNKTLNINQSQQQINNNYNNTKINSNNNLNNSNTNTPEKSNVLKQRKIPRDSRKLRNHHEK